MNDTSRSQVDPTRLVKETYIRAIRNSIGTKMFRSFYLSSDSKTFDATRDGELSCAFYVSSLLVIFQLIERIHGTIGATVIDLEASGWSKVEQPTPGSVIVWEAVQNDKDSNEHIGFYIGNNKAVSNSSTKHKVVMHSWTYDDARQVKAIYSHKVLQQ
jgi:hypothetical protein